MKKNKKLNPQELGRGYVTLMTCSMRTYAMKDLAFPIPAVKSGAAPVMGTHGEGVSLGLSEFGLAGFLAWLRLWLACVAEGRLAYKLSLIHI